MKSISTGTVLAVALATACSSSKTSFPNSCPNPNEMTDMTAATAYSQCLQANACPSVENAGPCQQEEEMLNTCSLTLLEEDASVDATPTPQSVYASVCGAGDAGPE